MPISFVVALNYVAAQWLLSGAPEVAALASPQREALGMLFLRLHTHGVLAVEIFWGLWLVPFGLLVMKSRFLPRVLGVLLVVAGGAYVAHSVPLAATGWATHHSVRAVDDARACCWGVPTMLWLLIKGADTRSSSSRSA
jgi:hypothetical protein